MCRCPPRRKSSLNVPIDFALGLYAFVAPPDVDATCRCSYVSMVKQEDEYAKQNNTQYPRSADYDVTLPESCIRIKMADGLPDFFI